MSNWSFQKWNKTSVCETQKGQEKLENLYNLKEVSVCLKRLSLDLQNGQLDLKDENVNEKPSYPKSKRSSLQNEKKFCLSASQPTPRKQKYVSKNKDQSKGQSSVVQGKKDYNRCMYIFPIIYNLSQSGLVIWACKSFFFCLFFIDEMAYEVLINGKNIEGGENWLLINMSAPWLL